ncbi:MAG TPA: glycosyltransferase family 1 protein, partial [Candidatus Riflebacteria bacterium]|nr:glycosyltransferase family 1 protein [Candidatus Riflebacteria bacterium]
GSEEDVDYEHVKLLCGKNAANLRRVLFTSEPQKYMAAADIFCLPSYREGFGQVVIEAAACEVPTVATRIYGIIDAVVENETGLLVSCGDSDLLAESLLKLIDDPELRIQLGKAARKRVVEHFSSNSNSDELVSLYKKLIDQM